jgi:hypothetical protein
VENRIGGLFEQRAAIKTGRLLARCRRAARGVSLGSVSREDAPIAETMPAPSMQPAAFVVGGAGPRSQVQ